MAGLSLGVMGGATAHGNSAGYSAAPATSATEMAYGPGYANTQNLPTKASVFTTGSHASFAFYAGIAAVGVLLLIRHSLPD